MNDRELLEMAAKAAGIVVVRSRLDDPLHKDMVIENSQRSHDAGGQNLGPWNPLICDGDVARLEAELEISVEWCRKGVHAYVGGGQYSSYEKYKDHPDKQAARRYAGTRAAAEIGRWMV